MAIRRAGPEASEVTLWGLALRREVAPRLAEEPTSAEHGLRGVRPTGNNQSRGVRRLPGLSDRLGALAPKERVGAG